MPDKTELYYKALRNLTEAIIVTDGSQKKLGFKAGINKAVSLILNCDRHKNKLIFIGNGASAAIASHMAVDFWKNGEIKAMAFNDASLLTGVANDFSFSQVFEKPVEMFGEKEDILIAISSSGKSENILKATRIAQAKGLKVITLSGLAVGNPLRCLGQINFYVPSPSYGLVEIMHHSICHCLVDNIIDNSSCFEKSK